MAWRCEMRMRLALALAVMVAAGVVMVCSSEDATPKPSPNGIAFNPAYKDWRLIATSHRTDNNTLRAILGNDVAIQAARDGNILPWPDGAVMAKVVWQQKTHDKWPTAFIPGEFVQIEFMVKDSSKYATTGGWGFARWVGTQLEPYGKDASFSQECFNCHQPVKDHDYVFTRPAFLP
jgi:hypothetical protein